MPKPPVKAQQLADSIAEDVERGRYQRGEWLPSDRQLAADHQVSRATAQQALRSLAAADVLEHVEGSGFRVSTLAAGGVDQEVAAELFELRQTLARMDDRLAAIERRLPPEPASGS